MTITLKPALLLVNVASSDACNTWRRARRCGAVNATPPAPAAPGPRTQAERRASTQRKLLEAAVDCLVERGYQATTVVDVQQRAGVSRGALQHYWPSRAALVVDAVKALFDTMARRLRADMSARAAGVAAADPSRRIMVAIELLWATFDSLLFRAELELWIAARRDADLRPLVIEHDRQLGADILTLCRDMFGPDLASHPRFEETVDLLVQGMRGAGIVAELHPKRGQLFVREWHRQTCHALDVIVEPE
jgi:AcrR family transcriptional regulator